MWTAKIGFAATVTGRRCDNSPTLYVPEVRQCYGLVFLFLQLSPRRYAVLLLLCTYILLVPYYQQMFHSIKNQLV